MVRGATRLDVGDRVLGGRHSWPAALGYGRSSKERATLRAALRQILADWWLVKGKTPPAAAQPWPPLSEERGEERGGEVEPVEDELVGDVVDGADGSATSVWQAHDGHCRSSGVASVSSDLARRSQC
ncbi:hypothetical protein HYQ46_012383 [Verticillium longisporum]|nr:hypothetical protein HYQ46_012383 [Verticillium longisporum]